MVSRCRYERRATRSPTLAPSSLFYAPPPSAFRRYACCRIEFRAIRFDAVSFNGPISTSRKLYFTFLRVTLSKDFTGVIVRRIQMYISFSFFRIEKRSNCRVMVEQNFREFHSIVQLFCTKHSDNFISVIFIYQVHLFIGITDYILQA